MSAPQPSHSTPPSQMDRLRCTRPRPISGGPELDIDGFLKIHKRAEVYFLVSSAAAQLTPVPHSYLPNFRPGAVTICFPQHTIIMFSKTSLTFLALGALYVNALTVPVARGPAPEPECEFPRLSLTISYHDLILVSLNSPRPHGPARLRVGQT